MLSNQRTICRFTYILTVGTRTLDLHGLYFLTVNMCTSPLTLEQAVKSFKSLQIGDLLGS